MTVKHLWHSRGQHVILWGKSFAHAGGLDPEGAMSMTTPATTSNMRDELERYGQTSVSLDYRARAAILQFSPDEQNAVHAGLNILAHDGLSDRRVRLVHGLSIGNDRGSVYEMRAPGAPDLRIFFTVSQSDGKTVFNVTDVLHRRALQNIARGS